MGDLTIRFNFIKLTTWIKRPTGWLSAVVFSGCICWILSGYARLNVEGVLCSPCMDVCAEQCGRITAAPLLEGDKIQQGDLLASFSSGEERVEQERLGAVLASLQNMLACHIASVQQATMEYIDARKEADMEDGSCERCNQTLVILQKEQTQVNDCKEQIATTKERLQRLQRQEQKKNITAPLSGVVTKRLKREGEVVQAGETIYSLCDPSQLWAEAVIPEQEVSRIAVRQKAYVRLPRQRQEWEGAVSWISPVALPKKGGVPVRIALSKKPEEGSSLRPNLSVSIKFGKKA
jgi:multidrug resistance efflux pump